MSAKTQKRAVVVGSDEAGIGAASAFASADVLPIVFENTLCGHVELNAEFAPVNDAAKERSEAVMAELVGLGADVRIYTHFTEASFALIQPCAVVWTASVAPSWQQEKKVPYVSVAQNTREAGVGAAMEMLELIGSD